MIKRCWVCILLIILLCGPGVVLASTNKILDRLMTFTDEEFFSSDPSVLQRRGSELLDQDFWGVAVSAPENIWTADVNKLPLIMAIAQSGDRDWDVRLPDNCILAGTNMRTGAVRFAKAFADDDERKNKKDGKIPFQEAKPPGLALRMAQLVRLDARQLQMEWNTGTWAIGVINFDRASNSVQVELQGDRNPRPVQARPVNPEPNPRGRDFLPCYRPTAKTPKPPEFGLRFSSEFAMEGNTPHLNIFGAFTVSVHDYHLSGGKQVHKFQDKSRESIAAVIPATLALVGLNCKAPVQFDWAIPVYGEPLTRGMLGRGYFSIDALAETKIRFNPGKYLCYIVMNGEIFGPEKIEVPKKNSQKKAN